MKLMVILIIIKVTVKLQVSVNNDAVYFFSSITNHIWILLVISSLHKLHVLHKS